MTSSEEAGGSFEANPYVAGTELLAPALTPAQPRVWTVFVALLAALGTILVTQIIFGIGLATWYATNGGDRRCRRNRLFRHFAKTDYATH